ncbi:transmembrane GTPase Marf isoform X1, partial [Brachionus plicatilis]
MMSDRMPSAKLLRNSSMAPLASNGLHSLNLSNESDDASSPLKLFKQAKQSMNSIYQDFNSIISEINAFFDSAELKSSDVVSYAEIQKIQGFKDKCEGLIKMISRDRMKCVFFGRTSNGKSSTINAMLHQKILPMGIGHTTNCFLQVEGSDLSEQDACFYIPGCDQPEQIKNLLNLGSALSKEKLDSSSLVRVLWPKEKCRLLKEDVVLVDSPGIDVSIDLDTWIDQNCLDADVFVLVVNAESTLTKTEKDFFH